MEPGDRLGGRAGGLGRAPHFASPTVAICRSSRELQQLIATVGPETNLGLALTTIKGNLQRIELGVAVDRDQWLLVADALKRVEVER